MKTSISTWCYNNLSREAALSNIAAFGVDGVEIVTHPPASHVDEEATGEHINYVKQLLEEHRLTVAAISPYTEFLQFDEKGTATEVQHVRCVVDLCVKLGADHVRIFAGGKIPEDRTQNECIGAVIHGLQASAQYASENGVRLSVENHGQFGRTFELFKEVMDAVPNVAVTLHTAGIEQMTDDYLGMVEYFAPRVIHTHLNDRAAVGDGFEPRSLGQGVLNFPAIFKILQDAGYSGYYNVEYGPSSSGESPTALIQESLAYLRRVLS